MGLFSSKTKYYVSSQIYNLAGDMTDRHDYMKTLTVQGALSGKRIAETIQQGLLHGPAYNLKSFQRWANTNYTLGLPEADVTVDEVIAPNAIAAQIPVPSGSRPGTKVTVINSVITDRDSAIWAEKYLAENHPDLLAKEWTVEQDDITNEIFISFADNHPDIVFIPDDWELNTTYLAVRYALSIPGINDAQVNQGTFGPFRTLGGMNLTNYMVVGTPTLQSAVFRNLLRRETLRTEYRDSRPSTETVDESTALVGHAAYRTVYQYDEARGYIPGTYTPQVVRHQKVVFDEKAVHTTVTREVIEYSDRIEIRTITQDTLIDAYRYIYLTQNREGWTITDSKVFLYPMGSGNAVLDGLRASRGTLREFLPMLPLRLNNKFIDAEPYRTDMFDMVSKAYKKSFGSKIDDFIDELKDNEDIDDLDYAYLVYGVTLNERDNSAKLYMYEFLKGLMTYQKTSKTEFTNYQNQVLKAQAVKAVRWNDYDRSATLRLSSRTPVTTTTEPPLPTYTMPARSSFVLDTNIPRVSKYKITISWTYIHEEFRTGVGRPGAKRGDLWFELGTRLPGAGPSDGSVPRQIFSWVSGFQSNRQVFLYHQTGDLTYRRLEIVGLTHSNYVYMNKSVTTEAYEAIEEGQDDESSFFLPLHMPTVKKLSAKEQNQLSTCSRLLLLNVYVKKKVKWYQRGIFKVIFMVAMIAISFIIMGPAGMAAAPGLLGTNATVGAMMGFAVGSTAAIIAGAVANMVAATILTTIIQMGAVAAFGDKWGQIIGAIASFVAMQVGTQFAATGNFNVNWGNIFKADNLIRLTSSVAKGYAGFMQAKIGDLMEDYENASKEYKEQMTAIEDKMVELLGQSAWIDPMLLTEAAYVEDESLRESSESFLSRTLLTGSDIADISMAMISEFPRVSIELPKAII